MNLTRISHHLNTLTAPLNLAAPALTTTLARFTFAAVLMRYYLNSAFTKLDGLSPNPNAYIQILPRMMEKAGYDPSALSLLEHAIVFVGTYTEILLPLAIVLGLATRGAALAMICFITVQSLVDVTGHGADAATIGRWFDRIPDAAILDQRLLWITLLTIPVMLGAGPLSLDRLIRGWVHKSVS